MGYGAGEGEGHGYVADMHPYPHLPEASDRARRPGLVAASESTRCPERFANLVNISAAGGLEALQFVQCFVEAALWGGLASGELRGYARLHVESHFLG